MTDWTQVPGAPLDTAFRFVGGTLETKQVQTTAAESAIIDQVSTVSRALRERGRPKGDQPMGHYLGTVPLALWSRWKKEDPHFDKDRRAIERRLSSPEFKKLRVDYSRPMVNGIG